MTGKHILPLLLLAFLALAPGVGRAAESYANCTGFVTSLPVEIGTEGVWCLKQNLSTAITSGYAIGTTSQVNNIAIDCNGFRIDGRAAGAGSAAIGVLTGGVNASVRHCDIRGFYNGIYMNGPNSLVEDNRVDGNLARGIVAIGGGAVIQRNRVFNTGGTNSGATLVTGIYTAGWTDVLDNMISGVWALSGSNANVFGIVSYGNTGVITGNRVRDLRKDGTGKAKGIAASGGNKLRDNDLVGNGSTGSIGLACIGPTKSSAERNIISGFEAGMFNCADNGGNDVVP